MKNLIWLLIVGMSLLSACNQQQDQLPTIAYLPIQLKEGYGPFHPGFSLVSNSSKNSPLWSKTYHSVKGIPRSWSKTAVSHIWLNTHQFIYQNFLAGNINRADYQGLQRGWHWVPDTTRLVKKPIKCYVYVIRGFDEEKGKWTVMVDTNNNLDFSDERAIYPDKIDPKDPYKYINPIQIQYEVYQKGVVCLTKLPMVLKTYGNELLYNFPQYATTLFRKEDKEYQLLLSSGFTRPDFEVTSLVVPSPSFFSKKVDPKELIEINDIIKVGVTNCKNKGVDVFNNWLELEPVGWQEQLYSTQVGHPLKPFKGKDFLTDRTIDVAKYRGKYVYIDFWATWCKGCVEDMPSLVKINRGLDTGKVAFIGIANDSPDRLKAFMIKSPIPWPQIIANDENKLLERYNIVGLPTSVLIDPAGTVIARNPRPDELNTMLSRINGGRKQL